MRLKICLRQRTVWPTCEFKNTPISNHSIADNLDMYLLCSPTFSALMNRDSIKNQLFKNLNQIFT